jgi:hypothetical protein
MGLTMAAKHELAPREGLDAEPVPATGAAGLVIGTVVALLATGGLLSAMLVLVNRPEWWSSLLAAGVVSVLSAAFSLPPLVWSLSRGMNQRVAAYFISMGLRAVVSLGGCVLAVKAGGYRPAPTLLMMVVFYFAVLAVETAYVSRALWNSKQ